MVSYMIPYVKFIKMSKKSNRELKIRDNTKNVSLSDFEWLVNQYGYIKSGGKHQLAFIGKRVFPYPRTNPIKPVYIEKLLDFIDSL